MVEVVHTSLQSEGKLHQLHQVLVFVAVLLPDDNDDSYGDGDSCGDGDSDGDCDSYGDGDDDGDSYGDGDANLRVRMMRGVSQATHMPVQSPKPEERKRKGR